ncbi:4'-phosphopantetheinyl transferase family protein [Ampullimonas aquatilis]|uniref:4'-phosphopantetheinyl transferase family protein n=1 Tax=Ampullimonas aquatilis TaxID=1341549 RepID=UPI003C7638A8
MPNPFELVNLPQIGALLDDLPLQMVACRWQQSESILMADDLSQLAQLSVTLPVALARAVPKRQREFLAGRYCAQLALQQAAARLGIRWTAQPIGQHTDRSPDWPFGWTGSISHTNALAVAVMAHDETRRVAIGIDVEQPLTQRAAKEICQQILCSGEQQLLGDGTDELLWTRQVGLIFSAKEAIFKALSPRLSQWLDFQDAQLTTLDHDGQFKWHLTQTGQSKAGFSYQGTGRYSYSKDLLATLVTLGFSTSN